MGLWICVLGSVAAAHIVGGNLIMSGIVALGDGVCVCVWEAGIHACSGAPSYAASNLCLGYRVVCMRRLSIVQPLIGPGTVCCPERMLSAAVNRFTSCSQYWPSWGNGQAR